MAKTFKPGEKVPRSAQVGIVGTPYERTVVKGKTFPPTPRAGQRYEIVDPTKHKSGK